MITSKPRHARRRSTETDIAIGQRIRRFRLQQELSQSKLGNALGVTFQQVQKYETGTNAVPSSRINALCAALHVTPDELYAVDAAPSGAKPLSSYAMELAVKIDKLDRHQKDAVRAVLKSFGVSIAC